MNAQQTDESDVKLDELEQPTSLELEDSKDLQIESVSDVAPVVSSTQTIMAVQAIMGRQSTQLDELKDQSKQLSESIKSILENDADLATAEQQATEASKKFKERRQKLAQSAESLSLKYKLSELRDAIKELEESLNNHLLSYYQLTGVKVFDTESGEQREFKITARVMGKGKKMKIDQ